MTCAILALLLAPAWKQDRVEVILHRQAGMVFPENSIPALEEAVRQGADGVEIDVRRTLDGQLVLYHDDWLVDSFGPGLRIEDLTLAEARRIDIGKRWGPEFRGLLVPNLKDVFAFAKANGLLLFLDVKTPGIDDQLRKAISSGGVRDLVIIPDRLAGKRPPVPMTERWRYLDGGEEDVKRMKGLVQEIGPGPIRLMADDARALALAMGRTPSFRPLIRYRQGEFPKSVSIAPDLASEDMAKKRRALWRFTYAPDESSVAQIRAWAKSAPDPRLRLDAITALGASGKPEDVQILSEILAEPTFADGPNHPSGLPYFDTYRQTAACVALARIGTSAARKVLLAQSGAPGFLPAASGLALAAWGTGDDVLAILRGPRGDTALDFALSYAGRHPRRSAILAEGLKGTPYARRTAVFGLARLAKTARPQVESLAKSADGRVQSGAKLALAWADGTWSQTP